MNIRVFTILGIGVLFIGVLMYILAFWEAPKEEATGRLVKLFYYNPELDKDENGNIMCSRQGLVTVEREIPTSQTPIQDTIRLLLKGGLTAQEKNLGISSEYPLEGVSLKGASLNNGVLTLEFEDPQNKTGGGSCRVGILWFQIEATAKQFSEVQQVHFLPEELFQP
ncbi:MAG: GerMN domain-containing protein [Candidatus Wildermuthbacteria bacterium]|nr:GerMN domain-containing protein [Candidatus Wildermuthbacteria bacterium]